MTAFLTRLSNSALRTGEWFYRRPFLAAGICAVIGGALVAAVPDQPDEDASALAQAVGVALAAFGCTLVIFLYVGGEARRLENPEGAALRAEAARREGELAQMSAWAIAWKLATAFLPTALIATAPALLFFDSIVTAVAFGGGIGLVSAGIWAWSIWNARHLPQFPPEEIGTEED